VQILQQAMWSWASVPADAHTMLSCTAGWPPVDRSLCHHDYRRRIPEPADSALSFDTPQLLSHCLHRGMPGSTPTYTPIHSRGGGPHVAAWAYNTAAAAAAAAGMP